jgi:predicted Zn-dependent protease
MIHGRFFDLLGSASHEAVLEAADSSQWRLRANGSEWLLDPATLQISDRIGDIPRRIRLPSGGEFETRDNDGVDALTVHLPSRSGWVHNLEQRWGIALAAFAGIAILSVLLIRYGLPLMAGWAADTLPPKADKLIGVQTLQILDRSLFEVSTLDPQRQASLQNLFARMTSTVNDGHDYSLVLRHSPKFGPNAFALPAGIVVMTDELVQLADNDEQLQAVLAHEIGHVRGRHALKQLIEGAGVSALALVILGDVSSITALASAAPLLIQARQSRGFETEADGFARKWLAQQGIAQSRFDEILCKITEKAGSEEGPGFLSSHPATKDRVHCVKAP